MGEHLRWPEPRTHDIASAFRHAGVPCDVTDNLARAHWLKLVWNIAFNGLGVASAAGLDAVLQGEVPASSALGPCLPTNELLGSSLWLPLVREVMLEVIAAANALNLKIEPDYADREIERTRGMGVYYASTLVDFERGSPLELKSLFLEPLRLARESQVPVPRLDALARVLVSLDRIRGTGAKSG
jgi:2-dehydropantoate 2-reductase